MYRIIDNIESFTGELLAREMVLLPRWRHDVVMRYKFEGGRRESTLAFRLLQQMLAEHYPHVDASNVEFEVGEHGKPSLLHHPEIHFNLSHCKYAVACAVADSPVGIDIECRGRYKHDLAAYCMSESEVRWIESEDTDMRFTMLWTKKEALLKLLGTGITDDIKTVLERYSDGIHFEVVTSNNYVCTIASKECSVAK